MANEFSAPPPHEWLATAALQLYLASPPSISRTSSDNSVATERAIADALATARAIWSASLHSIQASPAAAPASTAQVEAFGAGGAG